MTKSLQFEEANYCAGTNGNTLLNPRMYWKAHRLNSCREPVVIFQCVTTSPRAAIQINL